MMPRDHVRVQITPSSPYQILTMACPNSVRNILWDWQSLQPYVGAGATFFKSCDAIEVMNGVSAPATGWGLDHALSAWGGYFKNVYLPQREASWCRVWTMYLLALFLQCVAPLMQSMTYLNMRACLLTNCFLVICRMSYRDCLGTYNTSQSFWTDTTIDNAGRSWTWSECISLPNFLS